jgi:predicted acetyltransferase
LQVIQKQKYLHGNKVGKLEIKKITPESMCNYKVNFTFDRDVNEELNKKLIQILSICFPRQSIFKKQRYYTEMPSLRWYCNHEGKIVAHAALHEKEITTKNGKALIGGIAEVCVHPDYRGRGLVKVLLEKANKYSIRSGHKFSVLFGETKVYNSSGYVEITNDIKYVNHETNEVKIEKAKDVMVKKLADMEWPEGLIDINGPTF